MHTYRYSAARHRAARGWRLASYVAIVFLAWFCAASAWGQSFSPIASVPKGISGHTATVLGSGKIFVYGGFDSTFNISSNAYLYDPSDDSWTSLASAGTPRTNHTATLLANGKVLIAGGINGQGTPTNCDVYDSLTDSWSPAGNLTMRRYQHTATLLASGRVLVVGGNGNSSPLSTDVYDPSTNAWTAGPNTSFPHAQHTATVLNTGKLLVAGGYGSNAVSAGGEVYDPATNGWTATGALASAPTRHIAVLLTNGKVLIAGGDVTAAGPTPTTTVVNTASLYDPTTNTWSSTGSLINARTLHSAVLLTAGDVLVAGGQLSSSALASAEIYHPASNTWTSTATMATARYSFTATATSGGTVVVIGGTSGTVMVNTTIQASGEKYRPGAAVATSASLVSGTNPAAYGQDVVLTATISGGSNPSGVVRFKEGTTALCANMPLSGNTAVCHIATLAPGAHLITAVYVGDAGNFGSSASIAQAINKLTPSIGLLSSANPSSLGDTVTFTVTASGAATGTAHVYDSGTQVCTATLSAGSASCATAALAVGPHAMTAGYDGDANNTPASSFALLQQVNKVASSTVLSSNVNPSVMGQTVTFTAAVSGASPGGSVVFRDGTTELCTATLSAGGATCATAALTPGSHTVSANYGGDDNNTGSGSATLAQQVKAASASVLGTSCMTTFVGGQPFTVTASVSGSAPSGNVSFLQGTTTLCANVALSGGAASCTTSALTTLGGDLVDTFGLVASYSGDGANTSSDAAPLSVTVLSVGDVVFRDSVEALSADCPIE